MDTCKICNKECKSLAKHLIKSKNHPLPQEYYNMFVLEDDTEKQCNYRCCDNDVKFGNIKDGYLKYCSVSCCNKEKTFDPLYRKSNSKAQKICQNRDDVIKRSRESAQNQWKDSGVRDKTIKTLRMTLSKSEVKKQMSKSAKMKFEDPEFMNKFLESRRELWNDGEFRIRFKEAHNTDTAKLNHSKATSKLWNDCIFRNDRLSFLRSSPHRQHMSEIVTAKILKGIWNPHHGNYIHGHYKSKKSKSTLFYRSSLELEIYKILENNKDVIRFKSEPFRIPYIDKDGNNKFYIPDILVEYLDSHKEVIEAKPDIFIKDENVQLKIKALESYCEEHDMIATVILESDIHKLQTEENDEEIS